MFDLQQPRHIPTLPRTFFESIRRKGHIETFAAERSLPLPLFFGGPTIGCSAPVIRRRVHVDALLLARRILTSPSYRS